MRLSIRFVSAAAALVAACGAAQAQQQGPSTGQASYMLPSDAGSGVIFKSFATTAVNEFFTRTSTGVNDYRLVGLPDGQGAYRDADDIANGTFTLLVNHELNDNQGIQRRHGSRGSFVSKWKVRTSDLSVVSGDDSATNYNLWNISAAAYQNFNTANPMPDYTQATGNTAASTQFGTQGWNTANPNRDGIGRYCSGDLAPTTAYSWNGLGTTERIYMAGEERGSSGRAFAHVVTGTETGTAYELPRFGDFSWENSVASPYSQQKTVVIGTNDTTPGGIYVYVGNKQATGNQIEKAGLTNGSLYGIQISDIGTSSVAAVPGESRSNVLGNTTVGRRESASFTLHSFGDVTNVPGASYTAPSTPTTVGLQQIGDANQVVNFLRPEDFAWDTKSNSRGYFVTTDNTTANGGRSRVYAMDFTDITNPTNGGTVTMLAEAGNMASLSGGLVSASGATTFEMLDNICVTSRGYVLMQEDVGNNARLGRLWMYDPFGDNMIEIGISDAALFSTATGPLSTIDEETSGIIDASDILGDGWFLLNMQAHNSAVYGATANELTEGGQLMALYIPQSIPAPGAVALLGLGGLLAARRRR